MKTLILDFETYYDVDISLRKMSYTEYVTKTEPLLVCTIYEGQVEVICDVDIETHLKQFDWPNIRLVAHNTLFDALVLKHFYGIEAGEYSDTLSMARLLYPANKHDLGSCSQLISVPTPTKNKALLAMVKGSHLYDLAPAQIAWFKQYCEDDTRITAALYKAWINHIPPQELQLIDHTIKLFLNPILCLDLEAQMKLIEQETQETETQLESLNLTRKDVRSDTTFSTYIQSLGYEPPTQYSIKQAKRIPCFKKNAPEFLDFYEEHPELQNLLDLKISINSSIKRTRSEQLVKAAQIHQGRIPIAYNYCGAFTGRFSGTNKINMQNLPRGSALRHAITAPPGHVLVACDLSQIEVRVLAWLAGQDSILQIFREKKDPYCEMASLIYKKPVTKKDPDERFVGKSAVLGLGFSMSANKFQLYCAAQGRKLDTELCEHTVQTYRNTYPKIVHFWKTIGNRLNDLCITGPKLPSKWSNPTDDVKQIKTDVQYIINQHLRITDHQSIRLPSGREISYYGLHYDPEIDGYRLPNKKKVYGALAVENIVQGTARDIMCDMLLRVQQHYPVIMHTHDELVVCVEESCAEEVKQHLLDIMATPPAWAIEIPLDAEAAYGFTYGDCK